MKKLGFLFVCFFKRLFQAAALQDWTILYYCDIFSASIVYMNCAVSGTNWLLEDDAIELSCFIYNVSLCIFFPLRIVILLCKQYLKWIIGSLFFLLDSDFKASQAFLKSSIWKRDKAVNPAKKEIQKTGSQLTLGCTFTFKDRQEVKVSMIVYPWSNCIFLKCFQYDVSPALFLYEIQSLWRPCFYTFVQVMCDVTPPAISNYFIC